ncbi:MAG TPA: sulfotransferase [Streptosporangiaceae bacterium]|nr:sulfotransferase [Streptosporangiaceae bacterium]
MPRECPEESLKIIGAGFGRTGTLSLRAALCRLGFGPCHHMIDVAADPALERKWLRKARGQDIAWAEILGGYASIVDWPGCYYWEELLACFPQAKVILTVRDPAAWYGSAAATIYAMAQVCGPAHRQGMSDRVIWQGTFGGRFADKSHAIKVFEDHNRRVMQAVPPGRLLVYDIRAGWGPLCEFLGAGIPGASFPHVNERASFAATWQHQALQPRAGQAGAG